MDITFHERQSGKQGVVTLDGSLTLTHAEELRMLLIKALIDAEDVQVGFKSVADTDLSCLQVLCSAHRSACRMNRQLSLSGDWPRSFKQAVEDAGYARLAGCRLDVAHSCLWAKK